jgi:hypothetical protein
MDLRSQQDSEEESRETRLRQPSSTPPHHIQNIDVRQMSLHSYACSFQFVSHTRCDVFHTVLDFTLDVNVEVG